MSFDYEFVILTKLQTGGHNMQKEIEVADYLKEVAMTLSEIFSNDVLPAIIEANAHIFFNTFGSQTVEMLVGAYDEKPDQPEEAYKCLFVLFKKMGNENAEYFVEILRQGLKEMQEKEAAKWED